MIENLSREWFHVTTLSNFVKGYDKYKRQYSKANIPESTYPAQFFVLKESELSIGITKAQKLKDRLNLPCDRLIVLKSRIPEEAVRRDHASGLGQYVPRNYIDLKSVHFFENDENPDPEKLKSMRVEDVMAQSFAVVSKTILPWDQLTPRSISVLPIAHACQARCTFCFSKASVSSDFEGFISDWSRIDSVLGTAKKAGAERAVITGGGEPTLLKHGQLVNLVGRCASHFNKVVLITNGHILGRLNPEERFERMRALDVAGLSVLALSRHHHDAKRNISIMGLDTKTEAVAEIWRTHRSTFNRLALRLICVLQDTGVANVKDIEDYLSWASEQGIHQVNFKELYVSTSDESAYSGKLANIFSARHQVPLSIVYDFALKHQWSQITELPWGAPVYQGRWNGRSMQIAAYTEPSVYWERTHGIARSWNLMSDGSVLASLEDLTSHVMPR